MFLTSINSFSIKTSLITPILRSYTFSSNNETKIKGDCALIPKTDIPKHKLIWPPSKHY